MLLQEKMIKTKFSPAEKSVVHFILARQTDLEAYSSTMIAQETFTSPSVLVRISKKLGFSGFVEFKKAFLEEAMYLTAQAEYDSNLPFQKEQTCIQTAMIIERIKKDSMEETCKLLEEAPLRNASRLLAKAARVHVITISNLTYAAQEFVHKLRHIGIDAHTYPFSNTMIQEAAMAGPKDAAVVISYSGESTETLHTAEILRNKNIPIIALTSIGDNTLTKLSTIVLRCATREHSWNKAGPFSSLTSIELLLDILYACVFKQDFETRPKFKTSLSKATEVRMIDNQILQDEL